MTDYQAPEAAGAEMNECLKLGSGEEPMNVRLWVYLENQPIEGGSIPKFSVESLDHEAAIWAAGDGRVAVIR